MKIIVTLSALVLIVSLWGCSSKPAGTVSENSATGECAGMVGLVPSETSVNRNVSSTTCGEAAKTVAPASN